jgi:NAD+--asparagine ADP-ribosyltransferase
MNSKASPFTPFDYAESNEYKRLTPDEERTNKLRPTNKSLHSVNEPAYSYDVRADNSMLGDTGLTHPKYTYYDETTETTARNPNVNLSTQGGGFWDDFGRGFLMPFKAVGSVAPLIAKAI